MSRLQLLRKKKQHVSPNSRPGYVNHVHLTADDLASLRRPHPRRYALYGPKGPWSGRTDTDQNAKQGLAAAFTREERWRTQVA